MQTLETLKNKSQESVANLVELGKQRPDEVKLWGVTVAAGVGGALATATVAKGIVTVFATLASPPVAITVGALGGGALGWRWIQQQTQNTAAEQGHDLDLGLSEASMPEGGTTEVDSASSEEATAESMRK